MIYTALQNITYKRYRKKKNEKMIPYPLAENLADTHISKAKREREK